MKTMDTMETRIKDDKHFVAIVYGVVNEILPQLLNSLMEWKKPDEMPEDLSNSISRMCAISFHLHEYLEMNLMEDDAKQSDLLN